MFDNSSSKPRCAGICIDGKTTIYDLYRPGAGKKIKTINGIIAKIRDFLLLANDRGHIILTSNFKRLLVVYDLPLDKRLYNIYDMHMDNQIQVKSASNQSDDELLLRNILDKMAATRHCEYQKLIANAAVVYQDLENRGIQINDEVFNPEWSMVTYSGRSKTFGFNLQGFYEEHNIRPAWSPQNNVLLHFDWIAADIRVASLLSNDDALIRSFETSDPYTEMVDFFRRQNSDGIGRDECKKYLLRSINSMDIESDAFVIYPKLGDWIRNCYNITRSDDGILETILHRRFRVSQSKNPLAVLNGAMQGSVAHAMHLTIRKLWERIGSYILAEIHDSIILSVPNDSNIIRSVIDTVVPIMMYPFTGLLQDNPSFPLRVSIGKRWKKWRLLETHRTSGVERVKKE